MTRRPTHSLAAGLPGQGLRPATLALALALAFGGASRPASANPSGGVAVHGQASMASSGNRLTVTTQNGAGSSHSAINWQSFSIPVGNVTVFQQPNSASTVINRVVTNNPSQIFGTLSSNGRLVLVNQSGIAIGAGAVIDTAGFTASALHMTDADAIAGRMRFGDPAASMGGAGGITVGGRVVAREGDVVLIAPNVDIGAGALIQAPNGSTILAAGQQVEITGRGLEGIRLVVQAPENQARNLGRLEGNAVGMFAGTLRHSGEIQATSATLEGGKVLLKSSGDTYIEGAGKVIASGIRGGQVDVLGQRVAVLDQAVIDTSGAQAGGSIRIGGDYQGKNPDVPNATMTSIGSDTQVNASATTQGDGGRVIVWADDVTRAYGRIAADGGPQGGAGGFVETSGKRYLDVGGSRVSAASQDGRQGTWLLDPADLSIINGANGANTNLTGASPFQPVASAATATITSGTISAALDAQTNVVVTTANAGASGGAAGNITFDAAANGTIAITRTAAGSFGTLDIIADNNIVFSGGATNFTQAGTGGLGMEINLSAAAGICIQPGSSLELDGTGNGIGIVVKGGKTFTNSGGLSLFGASYVKLPNESGYASFHNASGASVFINSTGTWSFLSDAGVQGGIVNNDGDIIVNLSASGGTSWEALYNQGAGGFLSIANGKTLSVQNMGTLDGFVTLSGSGHLRLSEQHGGARVVSADFVNSTGQLSVAPGVTATLAPAGGSVGQLSVEGAVILSPGTTTQTAIYTQAIGGSSLTGGGDLTVTSQFNRSFGTFNPSGGSLDITHTGSGVLSFPFSLNLQNLDISANEGVQVGGTLNISGSAGFNTTGGIGGPINLSAPLNVTGNLDLSAASNIGIFQTVTVGGVFSASNTNSATPMIVRDQVTAASMSLNLNAGLLLDGLSTPIGAGLTSTGAGGQTIQALYLELAAFAGDGPARITAGGGGNQSITTTGNKAGGNAIGVFNVSEPGATVKIETQGGGNQTITSNNAAGGISVNAAVGEAKIYSSGSQTITLQGSGANSLVLGNASNAGQSVIDTDGAAQIIVVGTGAQAGSITLTGGTAAGLHNGISAATGTQSITTTGAITIQAGTAAGSNGVECDDGSMGSCAGIVYDGGVSQFIRAASLQMNGGASGAFNRALIDSTAGTGTQTIQIDGGGFLRLDGGASGDSNRAVVQTNGSAQNLNFAPGGSIRLRGGAAGTSNRARIETTAASSIQTISGAPSLTLLGGTGGGGVNVGNRANLFAAGSQNLTIGGTGISLTGGGGTGLETDNDAQIYQGGGAGTTQVINVTSGAITMMGGNSAKLDVGGSGHGSRALIEAQGDSQTITMTGGGGINLTGGTTGSRNFANIFAAGNATQSITGAGTIQLTGGASGGGIFNFGANFEGNRGVITTNAGAQTIQAGALVLTGGGGGEANQATVFSGGDQTITLSNGLLLQGGSGGGGAGNLGNLALVQTTVGNQTITVGAGGISMTGGSGGAGEINNAALIRLGDNSAARPGKVQTINVNGGGDITLAGGTTSEMVMAATDCGSCAVLRSDGDAQNITFSAGGMLDVAGGSGGIRNHASVFSNFDGTQNITGATGITAVGGLSGGSVGNGNFAFVGTNSGSQTVSVGANGILLQGGAGGVENTATIRQSSSTGLTSGTQQITVGGGAAVNLDGGGGDTNLARIQSFGANQTFNFLAGGALNLTGGTGSKLNYARVEAVNGNQSVTGLPSILVRGGASGGADLNGNFAQIVATVGTQNIVANQIGIEAGATGIGNFAVIQAPNQTISTAGDLHLTGGGSAAALDGTQGAGARIGGVGAGVTNLLLTVGNDLTMTGGSASSAGAAIGANTVGGNPTVLDITVNGGFGLYPGALSTAGARIGSPASNVAGGDITIHVPNGTFALNGVAPGETAVRTLGNVSVQANSIIVNNTITANTIVGDAVLGVSLGGAAALTATAASGNSLILDADVTAFSNTAGAGALTVQPGARWLVYSNDPLSDTVGGLAYDFKQYNASFNGGTAVQGSGNGLLYHAVPTVSAALVAPVSKVYDGTTAATLSAGNYVASLLTSGLLTDFVTLNNPVAGTYDTKNVGSGKTVTVNGVNVTGVVDSLGKPVFGVAPAVGTVTGVVGDISGASITAITGLLANPKVYDGTTVATIGGVPTFVGMAFGDSLTFNFGTADFNDKNVGNGKPVAINGVIVGGPDAGNYLSTPPTASAIGNVTPATITSVTGISINNKTYDGTTAAAVNLGGGATFNGMAPGDALVLAGATGAFVDKNASFTPKTVNISAIMLGGTDVGNYTLASSTATSTANISQAQITAVNGVTATKVYDGNTTGAPVTSGATLVGMVAGDNLSIGAGSTASYDTRHVGTGKALNVFGLSLAGADAGNYNLVSSSAFGTGTITQLASVTWTGAGGNQLWSNPANWAGNALPDGYNVAAVVIPASAGTVQIDPGVGVFGITSLTSGSPVQQSGSSLVTPSLTLNTQGGVALLGATNQIGALSGSNSGSGDIQVLSLNNMQLGPLTNSGGGIDVAVNGNLLVGGDVTASTGVALSALGTFYQNASILGPSGVSVSAATILPFGPLAITNGSPISYTASGSPVAPPPTELVPTDPGPGPDPIVVFLDLFEKASNEGQSDDAEVLTGDDKKKKAQDVIVAEGDVCR